MLAEVLDPDKIILSKCEGFFGKFPWGALWFPKQPLLDLYFNRIASTETFFFLPCNELTALDF